LNWKKHSGIYNVNKNFDGMRNSLYLVMVLIVACGAPETTEKKVPTDLVGLQQHLRTQKNDLRTLQDEIAATEARIVELDPTAGKSNKYVTIDSVTLSNFEHFVTVQGSIQADDVLAASSETGGRITSLLVDEGDYVKQGQLIAETDLQSIDKQIAELQTSLQLASDVFERQERLWQQKIGSEVQYLQAKNGKERLEKSIETLEFQKTKANVFAPISGSVDLVLIKEGEMSSPGMPIVQILNTSRLKVEADVPENLLASVKYGDKVKVFLPALNEEMERSITQLGRRIDPSNRTFRIEIAIPSRGILKPNLLAEIELKDFSLKDVVVIPQNLVQQEISGENYVVILNQDDDGYFAEKVYVEIGQSSDGQVIIEEGLAEGAQLITVGGRGLTEGERVQIASTQSESDES